jgi:S-adenosyl methyltransferase
VSGPAGGLRFRVRANRAFLGRVTRFLATGAGIRRLLDIGTVISTADNTHEVAQRAAPESRVVYADNDPSCLAGSHAHAARTHNRRSARD